MTRFEKCWGIYKGKGLSRAKTFPI